MKFACMTCGAKYSVPDGRLQAAGPSGLRVRCSRCRAIMVVADDQRSQHGERDDEVRGDDLVGVGPMAASDDDETRKELRVRRRPSGASGGASGGASAELMAALDAGMDSLPPLGVDPDMPAALSASGVYRPLPGVNRQVTGLFFPELEELEERKSRGQSAASRVWYAAIDNRPRGPFSATEMMGLAEKGKIRDATLVWRPGFSSWKKVKHGEAGTAEDLSWLRKIVLARKLREMDAQERAQQRLGILPVKLTRTSSGGRKATWAGGAPGMPPPLPLEEALEANDLAAGIDAQLFARSAIGAGAGSSPDAIPFAWRADELPATPGSGVVLTPTGVRRKQSRALFALAATAGAVAVAAAAVLMLRTGALERLAALLSP